MRLFGLTPEQIEAIEIPKPVRDAGLGAAAYMGKNHNKGGVNGGLGPTKRVVNVDEVKVERVEQKRRKVEVLKQLRKRLLAVRMANTDASENSKPGETTTAITDIDDNNDNNNEENERKRYGEGRDQRRRKRG